MAGFQLNLKNKGPRKQVSGFRGTTEKPAFKNGSKKNVFGDSDSEPDDDKIKIDSFDHKKGAMSKDAAVNRVEKKKRLVIKPEGLSKRLARREIKAEERNESEKSITGTIQTATDTVANNASDLAVDHSTNGAISSDQTARKSLLNGQKTTLSDLTIQKATDDMGADDTEDNLNYEDVPVEDFGAALMRGMGWKEKTAPAKSENSITDNRKKGVLLGIGAKAVEDEIMEELMAKSRTRYEVPMIRKAKGDS